MGDYRIVIDAVGGHGCQREVRDGGRIETDCGSASCPDCAARRFVQELRKTQSVTAARLEHWPANHLRHDGTYAPRSHTPGPIDDLITGTRHGSF